MSDEIKAEMQRLFNIVWERAKDKRKAFRASVDGASEGCAYLAEDELTCFWGACIPDYKYSPEFEGFKPSLGKGTPVLLAGLRGEWDYGELEKLSAFACDLQSIHDRHSPDKWQKRLIGLATNCGLVVPEEVQE